MTGLFLVVVLAYVFDESPDVFRAPDGSARAKLHGLGIAPGSASFPPCATADGDEFHDLMQAKKAARRDGSVIL